MKLISVTGVGDDWSAAEMAAGEAHAAACKQVLVEALAVIGMMAVLLSADKRAVVELTAALEEAALLAQQRLAIGEDDFALHALEVFEMV